MDGRQATVVKSYCLFTAIVRSVDVSKDEGNLVRIYFSSSVGGGASAPGKGAKPMVDVAVAKSNKDRNRLVPPPP